MTGRALIFSFSASLIYSLQYYANLPIFPYYSQANQLELVVVSGSGFAIFWYSWIAIAVAGGTLITLAIPLRWSAKVSLDLSWAGLVLAIFAALIYEKRWFL